MTRLPNLSPAEVKACCASSYSADIVSLLLGPSYHPGGLALTRRLLDMVGLQPGEHVADVASGLGTTAILAAQEYGATVEAVDLSQANVARGQATAHAAGLTNSVRFLHGDAEALPLADESVDVVVCECALCTFPNKATAAAEFARVLRPGGRVALSDMTADQPRLPDELAGIAAWVACVADARPAVEYAAILQGAGLRVGTVERHTGTLRRMVSQVEARLQLLAMTSRPRLEELGIDPGRARPVLEVTHQAIDDGILDYVVITAVKQ